MKWKFIARFALVGFSVAVLMASTRLYLLHAHSSWLYSRDSAWYDVLTFAVWPGAIYLMILQSREPIPTVVAVFSIAIVFNALIYGAVGWLVWKTATAMRWVEK
jgi:hypothetical protein